MKLADSKRKTYCKIEVQELLINFKEDNEKTIHNLVAGRNKFLYRSSLSFVSTGFQENGFKQ